MRDLGYSLETAVADLVDNSISAEATKVEIVCEIAAASPYLAVIDNGRRSEEHTSELQSLMRISYAVFCLKKKKKHNTQTAHQILVLKSKLTYMRSQYRR